VERILIVEDEARIADFIRRGLVAEGFQVTVVGDGESALSEAASGRYDLMILDLGLPLRDGMSVLTELRA
jgi:DNA-binding response OmpR family regulator